MKKLLVFLTLCMILCGCNSKKEVVEVDFDLVNEISLDRDDIVFMIDNDEIYYVDGYYYPEKNIHYTRELYKKKDDTVTSLYSFRNTTYIIKNIQILDNVVYLNIFDYENLLYKIGYLENQELVFIDEGKQEYDYEGVKLFKDDHRIIYIHEDEGSIKINEIKDKEVHTIYTYECKDQNKSHYLSATMSQDSFSFVEGNQLVYKRNGNLESIEIPDVQFGLVHGDYALVARNEKIVNNEILLKYSMYDLKSKTKMKEYEDFDGYLTTAMNNAYLGLSELNTYVMMFSIDDKGNLDYDTIMKVKNDKEVSQRLYTYDDYVVQIDYIYDVLAIKEVQYHVYKVNP